MRFLRLFEVFRGTRGQSLIREILVNGVDLVIGVLIFWAIIAIPLLAVFTIAEWTV